MRIVSGKFKGIRFEPPKNITARPTTDFAKEGLFSTLSNYIDFEGLRVLDLFSGTGSISYEFVSRGAKSVTAVEMSLTQIEFIKKTCHKLKIDNLAIYRSEVFKFLDKTSHRYNVVFADPPYQMDKIADIPQYVFDKGVLHSNGLLVLEHSKQNDFGQHPYLLQSKKYGNVHFSIFRQP